MAMSNYRPGALKVFTVAALMTAMTAAALMAMLVAPKPAEAGWETNDGATLVPPPR